MTKTVYIFLLVLLPFLAAAQEQNAASSLMNADQKLTIGGYGQVDYNQIIDPVSYRNGKMDVHRLVLLFGYKFTNKTQFITEVELEHVKEVYVEQAFVNHQLLPWLNFRAGLMLVPIGLTNLYHEPTAFYSVERPNVDKYIAPTTWREIGAGFAGNIPEASIKYELYLMNGFASYTDRGLLRGKDGLRKGRQKGAESMLTRPNLTGRLSYYGLPGLQFGLSGIVGPTQSELFNGLDRDDQIGLSLADSSLVHVTMLGMDGRYNRKALYARAQFYTVWIDNTGAYNHLTGSDLGSLMQGWYVELAYNLFQKAKTDHRLMLFSRYEQYNTQAKMAEGMAANPVFNRMELTSGLAWYPAKGTVFKADFQVLSNESAAKSAYQLNLGVGVWF